MTDQQEHILRNILLIAAAILGLWRLGRWVADREDRRATERWLRVLAGGNDLESVGDESQRRQWVRVPIRDVAVFGEEGDLGFMYLLRSSKPGSRPVREYVRDLSGGGLAFTSKTPPPSGALLRIALDLGPPRPVGLDARVVRVQPPPQPDGPSFVGLCFENVRPADREMLVQWVFRRQRDLTETRRRLDEGLCVKCGKRLDALADEDARLCYRCVRGREAERVVSEYRRVSRSKAPPSR
jgi:hypothetical protein